MNKQIMLTKKQAAVMLNLQYKVKKFISKMIYLLKIAYKKAYKKSQTKKSKK